MSTDIYVHNYTNVKDLYVVITDGVTYMTANVKCDPANNSNKINKPLKFSFDYNYLTGFYIYAVNKYAYSAKSYINVVNNNATEVFIGIDGHLTSCESPDKRIEISELQSSVGNVLDMRSSKTLLALDQIILKANGIVVDGTTYRLVEYGDFDNITLSGDDTVTINGITYGRLTPTKQKEKNAAIIIIVTIIITTIIFIIAFLIINISKNIFFKSK